ncbi:MAG: hypothetical protein AAFX94_06370, partial [Myxococcota bacterium]
KTHLRKMDELKQSVQLAVHEQKDPLLIYKFEALLGSGQSDTPSAPRAPRRRSDPTQNILVKAITLQPRKEAIIMFQGRIFNVRPGDNVGGVIIKDISESGLRIQRAKGGGAVIR